MNRSFTLLTIPILSSALLLGGCKGNSGPDMAGRNRVEVTGVTVEEVRPVEVIDYIEAAGTVAAKNTGIISSQVMGAVTSIKVKEGDRVSAGALLLTIDDSGAAQRLKAAEAGSREARKGLEAAKARTGLMDATYERYKKLFDEKALSRQEFDRMETDRDTARMEYERMKDALEGALAGVEEARVYASHARVTAPYSGVITEKKIEAGSLAAPGTPLLTIEDTSSYTVDAYLDESLSNRIRAGMPVDVVIESIGKTFKGTVSRAVPAIDPRSRSYLVKIALEGKGLRSGLYAKVRVPAGKKTALLLPARSIVVRGALTGVFTVDDKGVVAYRLVRTAARYNNGVEAVSGINPGDKIISNGVENAVDGGIVKTPAPVKP